MILYNFVCFCLLKVQVLTELICFEGAYTPCYVCFSLLEVQALTELICFKGAYSDTLRAVSVSVCWRSKH